MTDSKQAEELNRAADRLTIVTRELSQVLERLVELERSRAHPEKIRGEQPRPKVPLLSGGKDPTLAERFEEELHGSSTDA